MKDVDVSKLEIITYPNTKLKMIAQPLDIITGNTKALVEKMLEIMYENNGVGLAAPQLGVLQRIVVLDPQIDDINEPHILINPTIISHTDELTELKEGCLSLPGLYLDISRPNEIVVEYMDINGEIKKLEAADFLAKIIQHEIDHLNGKLIIDHLSSLKKQLKIKEYHKILKENEEESKEKAMN
jgi:peptide deformylase